MTIFLVTQWRKGSPAYEIQGVYDSVELAESTCLDETYSVMPLTLNERLDDDYEGQHGWIPALKEK